jgi:peptidoglycan/xylan/chitin deacetylase (PgdA/CDA1 family)
VCVHAWNCNPPADPCQERQCVDGECQYGPKNCADDNDCTADSCNEATGECEHVDPCDDGNGCTEDLCVNGDCAYRWLCDDGDPCTIDECVEGNCVFTPKDCDDQDPCTLGDYCDQATGECVNTPKDCDDGDDCTDDSCDSTTGDCVFSAPNCDCLNGQVWLGLSYREWGMMRINADFDKNLAAGHREDFRDPDTFTLVDDDLLFGGVTISPAKPGQLSFTFDASKIGLWVCQGDASCGSDSGWQRVSGGIDWDDPAQPIYVAVEGLDGSAFTDDAQITPHFSTNDGCTYDGDPAPLTVVKSEFMLTFDDGPFKHPHSGSMNTPPDATATIIAALSNVWVYGTPVHAGFFVVGHDGSWAWPTDPVYMREGVDGDPDFNPSNHDLVQAAASAGHALGNHTNTHNAFFGVLLPEVVSAEIDECNRKLGEAGLNDCGLFRPPYFGGYAALEVVLAGAATSQKQVIWGSAYNDWQGISAEVIAGNIVAHMVAQWNTRTEPQRRLYPNIVVLHDCAPATASSLYAIVNAVRAQGFVLVDFDPSLAQPDRDVYQWFPN